MKATYIAILATSFATVRSSYNTMLQHIPTLGFSRSETSFSNNAMIPGCHEIGLLERNYQLSTDILGHLCHKGNAIGKVEEAMIT